MITPIITAPLPLDRFLGDMMLEDITIITISHHFHTLVIFSSLNITLLLNIEDILRH